MKRVALHWQILIGMLAGATVGIVLNNLAGERQAVYEAPQSKGRAQAKADEIVALESHDTPNLIRLEITTADGKQRTVVVDGTRETAGSVATLDDLKKKDLKAYTAFRQHGRSTARWVGDLGKNIGDLFLRLLRMVAIPLIVASLITGVLGLGDASRLGRMFGRTLLYYLTTSLLAIITGLCVVNAIRPGLESDLAVPSTFEAKEEQTLGEVLYGQLETLIPTNPFAAMAGGGFLSVISFSLAFGIFGVLVGGRTAEVMRDFFGAAFDIVMAMTMAIIKLAPIGVTFLMLYVTATQGAAVFQSLFWYMLAVACALTVHAVIILPLILYFVARRNPLEYVKAMSPALLTAFSSASSNGTLPLTIASVEKRAGISNRVSSFVLPLGATINMDGTALYEAVAVLFIAQLYHGANLPLSQQIIVAVTALLVSIGAAGIPHAGLVMMVIILQAVNLPPDMQGIILAVDRILDMARTMVNVWSDSCGCAVIARFEAGRGGGKIGDLALPSEPT